MGTYCIFCDSKQRSKEHVFPSSFGGQLVNSKIYCETHNSELGKYVALLNAQIGNLNNIYGIQPDRGDAKSIKLKDHVTGDTYLRNIEGEIVYSTLDNINEDELLSGKIYDITSSSYQDIENLRKNLNRKHGANIEVLKIGESKKEVFRNPLVFKITWGGADFFKSILYLSITFIAHYSRDTIDNIDIKSIQNILLNNDDFDVDEMVSLEEFPSFLKDDEKNVMHSFAFIKNNNHIYSIFSFFNAVTYVMKISEYKNDFRNFVIYIYPLTRTKNPNDSMIKEVLPEDISISFNPALHKKRIKQNLDGDSNSIIKRLEKKLSFFESNRQNNILIKGLKGQKTSEEMKVFWLNNKQHILNSINFLSKENSKDNNFIEIAIEYINLLLKTDSIFSQYTGVDIQNKLRLIKLDCFINDVCENLSDYYTINMANDDEFVFDTICKEILKQATINCIKLFNLSSYTDI